LGAKFAKENDFALIEFKPDWKRYGKAVGIIRNHDSINACTHCIVFWDGKSRGAKHDIELCEEQNMTRVVVTFQA
jgi:hypothetical protein